MVVLRSREVSSLPRQPNSKTLKRHANIEPATPAKNHEPATRHSSPEHRSIPETVGLASDCVSGFGFSTRRRSARLALKSVAVERSSERDIAEKIDSHVFDEVSREGETASGSIEERVRVWGGKEGTRRKRKLEVDADLSGLEDEESKSFLSLRSGKRIVKRRVENGVDIEENYGKEKETESIGVSISGSGALAVSGKLDFESEAKNLADNVKEGGGEDRNKGKSPLRETEEDVLIGKLERSQSARQQSPAKGKRFSTEEKGKGKIVEDAVPPKFDEKVGVPLESEVKEEKKNESKEKKNESKKRRAENQSRMERFRNFARQNAHRFAHFNAQAEEEDRPSQEADREVSDGGIKQEIEDWPGPFSTAMKIIRERAEKGNLEPATSSSAETKSVPVTWIPKRVQGRDSSKLLVPTLQELSMKILVKNADAITSLEYVPDGLRHKLSQLLCDSRRMNSHILDLLVRGSPTEIRLPDCSWLTEEEFTKCFEGCDTRNLMVLQLDQSGRCLPDYILLSTLTRSSDRLSSLTTLSLNGACRLSDVGLHALVSFTPSLRSINVSQCSLLTAACIETLANFLGSVLRELYIDDCQAIDAMLILPALKKLEHLEVLSVARIETVCDRFVREFITARGHNMKKLTLTDCVRLTDSSMKIIAERCDLRALDLVNLCKLTDSALDYLANGCQAMRTLKLCRNAFSDEAVAAFLETSGGFLKELSLNNVKKVGNNTAVSLARCSRKLHVLDLSWCRNLTDEAVGLIVDSCLSLRVLKIFGCTQITNVFLDGHSNPDVKIVGVKMSPVLEHLKVLDAQEAA